MYGTLYFEDEETNEYYEIEIEFDYHYDPGRYYMPNGDPGYPPEETAEITKIYNDDKIPSWITEEMIDDMFDDMLPDLLEGNEPDYED